ncbi:hypothetical protein ATCC90586_008686 [Pythium insidiosum]|nr:hypothetical protein ATCC90586_008686 [Pythium insidiosum]
MSSWRVHCALHGVQGDPTFTECCAVLQGISALSGDGLDYQIHPVLGVQGLRDLFNSLRIDATDASNDAMLARVQCTNGVSTLERVLVNREAFLSFMRTVMERHLQGESPLSLWGAADVAEKPVIKIFVSGDRSQVGKSTVCLGLVGALLTHGGYRADEIGYIKPATQCEQPQLIAKFCRQHGIECCDIGPIVFYSGFTREFLRGNTESSTELLANARAKVEEIGRGKRVLIVDGVGYPAVGSICGVSNASVANAVQAPVVLVGKKGVGDAIDSFNLNACFFESQGVRVLGAIFNRLPEDGFYSLANCRDSIHRYFEQFQPSKRVYGFIPELPEHNVMEDVAACCQPVTMGNRWISAVLLLAAVITTCVNEQRLIREASGLEECQRNAVPLADPVALPENDGKLVHFHGIITTDPSTLQGDPSLTRTPYVLDPVFGIAARGVRLLRNVEMLQWVETSHTVDADGDGDERAEDDGDQGAGRQRERVYMYDLRWRSEHVDSSSFYDRSFQNPSQDAWIFQGKDIVADATVVGDFKLSDELIMQIPRQDDVSLSAESMAVMRNVLNQRVGEHWAEASSLKLATIEDNYVYMLRDGGSPTLGDLRISFKVVPPYTVTISGKQEMQHIRPFQATNGESILLIADGALGVSELYDQQIQKKDVVISAQAIAQQAQHEQHAMDMEADDAVRPNFPALSAQEAEGGKNDFRRVRVPAHRYTPLKNDWPNLMTPIVDHLKLQIRMNTKTRCIELKNSPFTEDSGALQKAADFVQAYMMGFEVQDAVALLRLEDLFIDTFEVNDVKMLKGDHLSRAIGRVAGQDGKTKYAIENATRTRIVLADQKIHILGSFANIKLARDAICSLIMGAPPGKVYNKMRGVASRMNERF